MKNHSEIDEEPKRKDSTFWWVKITPSNGRCVQQSTGTADKVKAQEYHDKLKASLCDQERLGIKPALLRAILIKSRDEWEWLERVPKIKHFKESADRKRSLTPEQAQDLLRELPLHQRECVMFALATGLRQSNVLKLEWSNVDIERRHAWVSAINSKNRKPIVVPLNDISMAVLLRQKGKHSTRVFTYAGKPIANANTKAWRSALLRTGIADFRWHDLRHTWATWQRQSGTPTYELQKLGGWKTATMVERYAHLAPDNLSVAAGRINGMIFGYDLATVEGQ